MKKSNTQWANEIRSGRRHKKCVVVGCSEDAVEVVLMMAADTAVCGRHLRVIRIDK